MNFSRTLARAVDRSIRAGYREQAREERREEREAVKAYKELEKFKKEYARLSELERCSLEVKQYENYIDRLLSVHKDCCPDYNWIELEKSSPPDQPTFTEKPVEPEKIEIHETENYYQNLIDNYEPSFCGEIYRKIFGDKKLKELKSLRDEGRLEDENKTLEARKTAEKAFEKALENWEKDCERLRNEYEEECKEHAALVILSKDINRGDISAYLNAVKEINPFKEIAGFGSKINIDICSTTRAKAVIEVHGDTIIPKQSKVLLKSGKVSVKDTPAGKFNEIYQDYICSVSIRVARDLFAILPLKEIIVTAAGDLLNKSTGNMENVPLLSVMFVKETMDNLNFDNIDPSDAMKNFRCNMSFKKSQGMDAVPDLEF